MLADSTTPGRPRSRAEDDLNQFIDALVSGHAPKDGGLDPKIASAARHVHDLPSAPADQRLKREIWASLTAKELQAHGPVAPLRIARSHRPVPWLTPADRPQTPTSNRLPQTQGRDRGAFATAAFLVILMAMATGGFFVLERPQSQRSSSLPAGHVATPAPSSLYIGHFARLTASIPSDWTVDPSGNFDYAGPDGFVRSEPVAGQSLRDACAAVGAPMARESSDATISYPTWSGKEACRIDGALRGVAVAAIVVPHPNPFSLRDEYLTYAAVIADPGHLDGIGATIDFSPERVTPEAYAISLLDLLETRALWSHQLHWPTVRQQVLDFADGFETVEIARVGILSLITQNVRLTDDLRTSAVTPDRQSVESQGFGALVIEKQVVLVYPGSPAEQAGIRVGDRIEEFNGRPVVSSMVLLDASMQMSGANSFDWSTATLTVLRPGTAALIDVSITSAPYELFLLPTGARVAGNIGQLMLPGGTQVEHEDDYVSTSHETMTQINADPVCGWIVDLRLAYTSSYPPILASIGPLLGDGAVAAWRGREGGQSAVAFADGVVTEDGYAVADFTGVQATTQRQPETPIAVLTGPYTAHGGEVAALALAGQPETRLFGERTRGDTELTRTYPLFDGSSLFLAEAMLTDLAGAEYPDGIQPDEEIPNIWAAYGTDADPAIAAAREWLAQQPSCAAMAGESWVAPLTATLR